MGMVKCTNCGEIHRDYDQFCPVCGKLTDSFSQEADCDGNCLNCEYDMLHGCSKPRREPPITASSPYPHFIHFDKNGNKHIIEEDQKRNRAGTAALAILPTGALGIHDFYARRYWQGIIHLLLSILSVGGCIVEIAPLTKWSFILSWAYAVVEGILVAVRFISTDGKGYPFA